ncbi:MAG: hypothetical protein EXS51_01235 [Candidatus Taylorbacteria bacterium]|nr:hypothetical protein [Candidatus Taylorbacteria bacterium]
MIQNLRTLFIALDGWLTFFVKLWVFLAIDTIVGIFMGKLNNMKVLEEIILSPRASFAGCSIGLFPLNFVLTTKAEVVLAVYSAGVLLVWYFVVGVDAHAKATSAK